MYALLFLLSTPDPRAVLHELRGRLRIQVPVKKDDRTLMQKRWQWVREHYPPEIVSMLNHIWNPYTRLENDRVVAGVFVWLANTLRKDGFPEAYELREMGIYEDYANSLELHRDEFESAIEDDLEKGLQQLDDHVWAVAETRKSDIEGDNRWDNTELPAWCAIPADVRVTASWPPDDMQNYLHGPELRAPIHIRSTDHDERPLLSLRQGIGGQAGDLVPKLRLLDLHDQLPAVFADLIGDHRSRPHQLAQMLIHGDPEQFVDPELLEEFEDDHYDALEEALTPEKREFVEWGSWDKIIAELRETLVSLLVHWHDETGRTYSRINRSLPFVIDWRRANPHVDISRMSIRGVVGAAIAQHREFAMEEQRFWALEDVLGFNISEEIPESLELARFKDGARIVELRTVAELWWEGKRAGHCIGESQNQHPQQLEAGLVRVFSYRDPKGKPRVTWECGTSNLETTAGGLQGPRNGPIHDKDAKDRMLWFLLQMRREVPAPYPEASIAGGGWLTPEDRKVRSLIEEVLQSPILDGDRVIGAASRRAETERSAQMAIEEEAQRVEGATQDLEWSWETEPSS